MKIVSKFLFLALLCSTILGSSRKVSGQTPYQENGAISEREVKVQLEALGYTVTEHIDTNGAKRFSVPVLWNGRTYPLGVGFSADKSMVWLYLNLIKIEKPENSGGRFQKLLENNYTLGASTFSYNPNTQLLMLHRPIDNRGITAKILDDKIDRILRGVESTRADWDFDWNLPISASARQGK
ncbi:type III secretion system chaperone [Telmatocola sphagniphila]|uniref:Type III secretion system chaperone n=1 Tax=Telmatocola sphagniphila TaxID=1123043 RepID=A0A8E6B9V8_9BACT|nr:type III secretion system chaperone [Telmatocola sphagniphila]QVL33954.1 type III secretion system chaperone [Telmatocola sphagniphila]